jgi:hypothetical protein
VSTEVKLPRGLAAWRGISLGAMGVGGIIAVAASAFSGTNFQLFFQAFLYAWILVIGLSFGSMALMFIHHMTAGQWSFPLQRIFEAAGRTIKWMAIPFAVFVICVWLDLNKMYNVWTDTENPIVQTKSWWLNLPFWTLRNVIYFVAMIGLAETFSKWSKELESSADALVTLKFRRLAPVGLLIYVAILTFAPLDWVMSLEPQWFSTMYAPLFAISQGLTVFILSVLILEKMAQEKPMSNVVTTENYHLLGTFMCAFVVLWTYMSFSQFMIIWSGNLPEEIHYYLSRSTGFYQIIIALLVIGHFFLPFLILLQRKVKYNINVLRKVCYAMLFMRLIDLFYIINPAFHQLEVWGEPQPIPGWDIVAYLAMVAGLGGFWMYFFLGELTKMPFMPKNDPRLYKAISHIDQEALEHV